MERRCSIGDNVSVGKTSQLSRGPCNSSCYMVVLAGRSLLGRNMRRHLLSLLALASFAAAASAPSFSSQDTVAYATATIRMRERPSVTSETVAILGQGTRVRLYHCSEGWCGVSIQKLAGYALEEYLTTKPPRQVATAPTQQGRGYVNVDGEWVPSPTRTADGQPPPGASAKCRDGTFSFSRHRQGTCSHHGGVAQWL